MQPVTVTIPGPPIGKGRPRFSRASGHAFTPSPTRNREAYIRMLATEEMAGREPMTGPIAVVLLAAFEPPASWSKVKRLKAIGGNLAPTGRPDLDNLLKLATDALNGIVFRDDAQIISVQATKTYAPRGLMVVTVRGLEAA